MRQLTEPLSGRIRLAIIAGLFLSLLGSATALIAECAAIDGAELQGTTSLERTGNFDSKDYCGWQTLTTEIGYYLLADGSVIAMICSESSRPAATQVQ